MSAGAASPLTHQDRLSTGISQPNCECTRRFTERAWLMVPSASSSRAPDHQPQDARLHGPARRENPFGEVRASLCQLNLPLPPSSLVADGQASRTGSSRPAFDTIRLQFIQLSRCAWSLPAVACVLHAGRITSKTRENRRAACRREFKSLRPGVPGFRPARRFRC